VRPSGAAAVGYGFAAGLGDGAAIGLAMGLAAGDAAGLAAGFAAGEAAGLGGAVGFSAGVGSGVFAGGLAVWQALSTSRPAAASPSRPRRENGAPRDTSDRTSRSDMKTLSSSTPRNIHPQEATEDSGWNY
jgi:hypothetical protein